AGRPALPEIARRHAPRARHGQPQEAVIARHAEFVRMTTSVIAALAALEAAGETAALCTIVREQGSVPRHTGSKMLVYPDGRFIGTVGGGEMESRVIRAALET